MTGELTVLKLVSLRRARRFFSSIVNHRRPMRLAVGLGLWHSRLCYLFNIRRDGYFLRYYPSSISAMMWVSPEDFDDAEEFVRTYLRPGEVAVDVGANIGALSLSASLAVGPAGRVYAVEAHPRTYRFLRGNLRANGATNVTTFQCALGTSTGKVAFSDLRGDDLNAVAHTGKLHVPMRRLDDLPIGGAIALLKIDVEGFEVPVISGAARALDRTNCVYWEACEANSSRFGYTARDAIAALTGHGFRSYRRAGCDLYEVGASYVAKDVENIIAVRDPRDLERRTGWSVKE